MQDEGAESNVGTSAEGKKTWTVIDKLLETQCGQVWELKKKKNRETQS